jgi:3'-5' exoribonuclease
MKSQYINDLKPGEQVSSEFVISNKAERSKKNGEKFCLLILQDKSGFMDGVIWNESVINFSTIREGDFVRIDDGIVNEYRSKKQIEISSITRLDSREVKDKSDFEKTTKMDIGKMVSTLMEYIESVENPHLQKLLAMFFKDEEFLEDFCSATAAVQYHHAYRGGLLEHTLSVLKISEMLSKHYRNMNRDLLIAGSIFHDIGKMREYRLSIPIKVTDEGRLLGHITIGYGMVLEKIKCIKGFPEDLRDRLLHIVLSHHGQKEFGSPRRPKTLEAFIVYHIDYMDADIGGFNAAIEANKGDSDWSEYMKNFERSVFLKKPDFENLSEEDLIDLEDQDKLFRL